MKDLNQVYSQIQMILEGYEERFKADTEITLWDGDWNLLGQVVGQYDYEFTFLRNDAGSASLVLPIDHYLSEMLIDKDQWPTKSLYLVFEKDGSRWSGRIENMKVTVNYRGDRQVELSAVHDYNKLKELLVWSNPFLPASVQFPKAWFLFGPAKWAVTLTLFVNLLRKNVSLWSLPDDPLDFGQWFDLDMSDWNMAVIPSKFFGDSSPTAVVSSRFKYFHDCVIDILNDAQLTIECRRYLPDMGDEHPFKSYPSGEKMNLRQGCLVIEVVDKSGWNKETAVAGALTTGFIRGIKRVTGEDGMIEELEIIDTPTQPAEYSEPKWFGTSPRAPWVTLEHGDYTSINASEFDYTPAGPIQWVVGGSSMPGINETIKAAVIGIGGFIGSLVGQSQVGSVAAEVLEPVYSDVFMAFNSWKDRERAEDHGWDAPYEYWADGADKAFTVSAVSALRKAKYDTNESISTSVEMTNGAPYYIGPQGYGDFFVGDLVGVHALGMPKDKLYVEMVESATYRPDSGWSFEIGKPTFKAGLEYLADKFERSTSALKELGVW